MGGKKYVRTGPAPKRGPALRLKSRDRGLQRASGAINLRLMSKAVWLFSLAFCR